MNESLERGVSAVANGMTLKEAAILNGVNADYLRHVCVSRGVYTPKFVVSKDRKAEAIRMITAGFTASQITDQLGYANISAVYNIARSAGLKCRPEYAAKHERIAELRRQGKSCGEIAEAVGMTGGGVAAVVNSLGLQGVELKPQTERRNCRECGIVFIVPKYSNKVYCSTKCQAKATRGAKDNADDSEVPAMLNRYATEWEYIGGYTGSDGTAIVRHRCGYTTRKSMVTIRHRGNTMKCVVCEQREREEKKEAEAEQRRKAEAVKRFNRKIPKYEQQGMKSCAVCGGFFFGKGSTCGEECRRVKANHYYSMKKEKRRKKAMTEESSQINVRSLFERDGGICWLCGGLCDLGADPNSDKYPSVDHVVPIADGGLDEWDNVRLAHRWCNTKRGDRQSVHQIVPYWVSPVALKESKATEDRAVSLEQTFPLAGGIRASYGD